MDREVWQLNRSCCPRNFQKKAGEKKEQPLAVLLEALQKLIRTTNQTPHGMKTTPKRVVYFNLTKCEQKNYCDQGHCFS